MDFTVLKTSNEIEDICIAYGLCKLLKDNELQFELHNLKSRIVIETEDFEFEDLDYTTLTIEECRNVNSSMTQANIQSELNSLNPFMEENLIDIFQYFHTLDIRYLNKQMIKKADAIGVGNCYSTLGVRASQKEEKLKLPEYKRHLSFLGWVSGVSYIRNDNIEITSLLIPKNTDKIYNPFKFKNKNNETIVYLKDEKEVWLVARQYLETLREYNFIKENYKKIIFMQLTKAGKKPLADISFELPLYGWCSELIESFSKTLRYSTVEYNAKDITAKYIVKPNYINFSKLIKIYAKYNQKINSKFKEELLQMYSDRINDIYNNEIVIKLGAGLSKLFYYNDKASQKKRNMCYEIQVQLLNVSSKYNLQRAIKGLIFEYERVKNTQLLNQEELLSVINLIKDNKESKICADALLAHSKVFINFDKQENKIENIKEEI